MYKYNQALIVSHTVIQKLDPPMVYKTNITENWLVKPTLET